MEEVERLLLPLAFYGGPMVAALLLALLVPVSLIGVGTLTARASASTKLSAIFLLIIVGSTLSVALSGRTLHAEAELALKPWLVPRGEGASLGTRVSQLCTGLVLLLVGAEWLRWLVRRVRLARGVAPLWGAALAYFFFAMVVSGLFGVYRQPRLNDLYVIAALAAIALLAEGCDTALWRRVRWALLLPSAGSLLAIAVAPQLVLMPDFKQTLIPGLTQRLYGLSDHANAIGVVAAVGLALEFSPQVRQRPAWAMLACHFAVLVLAQSKTAMVAALLAMAVVRWSWLRDTLFKGDRTRMTGIAVVAACGLGVLVLLAVGLTSRSDHLLALLDRVGIFTFTGRTGIWQITLEEFARSPLTGYGPSLWDLQFRYERGMMQAGQAHNQFVQILGQAGALGLLSMLAYLAVMGRTAWRHAAQDHGLALVLLLILLVRCLTESPLRLGSVMGWDAWIHLAAFAAAVSAAAAASRRRSTASDPIAVPPALAGSAAA